VHNVWFPGPNYLYHLRCFSEVPTLHDRENLNPIEFGHVRGSNASEHGDLEVWIVSERTYQPVAVVADAAFHGRKRPGYQQQLHGYAVFLIASHANV
jgi:hypothetical protein